MLFIFCFLIALCVFFIIALFTLVLIPLYFHLLDNKNSLSEQSATQSVTAIF